VPRRELSREEKRADLAWVFSQFGHNYAPLKYKENLFGFNYEELKSSYLERSDQTQSNQEFFDLLFELIAEFKDAHTSGSLAASNLPGRATVSYLGFSGVRSGDALLVKRILPTSEVSRNGEFPIQVDDKILKVNGKDLKSVVREELLKFRDLGQEEANYTFHFNRIFNRSSISHGIPAGSDVLLTVKRRGKTFEVSLPWIKKDIVKFQEEQQRAASKAESVALSTRSEEVEVRFNFMDFHGRITSPLKLLEFVKRGPNSNFRDRFLFVDQIEGWAPWVADAKPQAASPRETVAEVRSVPSSAVFLENKVHFPAFISREKVGEKFTKVGTIFIDGFNKPKGPALEEFRATLATFQEFGIQHLVLDLINNGGGSLVLGLKMAQALSAKPLVMPDLQFRLSDGWLDDFERESLGAGTDAEQELSRRVLQQLETEKSRGQWISSRVNARALSPFEFTELPEMEEPFKVVVLINEICASMCDIFAAVIQDNQLGSVVGSRSMGAGGNVVNYQQAPNSHLDLRQTESLVVRRDGTYIENVGVTPDVTIENMSEGVESKFSEARTKALRVLLKQEEVVPSFLNPLRMVSN
jgi:C-terminal processing protease CtpA/Prc